MCKMNEVILVFVRDYEINGEYRVWTVYSEWTSEEQIAADIQRARDNTQIGEDTEYCIERWNIWNN